MPIGRGIMQTGRLNIAKTQTIISFITPVGSSPCGTTVNFQARVTNLSNTSYPTGTVNLIDENNVIVGTETLVPGLSPGVSVSANMPVVMTTGNHTYRIEYDGVLNTFAASRSVDTPYSGTFVGSTIVFNDLSGSPTFCPSQSLFISLTITPTSGSAIPTGVVNFKLYSNNINSVDLPSGTLLPGIGSAVTAIIMPAFTTDAFISPTGTFYIQAIYPGDSCFAANSTPPGIQTITDITTIGNIATTSLMDPGFSFSITNPIVIGGHVTRASSPLQNFTIGTVSVTATKGLTTINLGSTNLASGGFWALNVPANTFPSTGNWGVVGNYISDGYCYLGSSSAPMTYTAT